MGRLATAILKGAGVLLLAMILLSVIATIVGLAVSIVMTVLSLLVSLAVLALFVLAIAGLWSVVSEDGETDRNNVQVDDRDPEERLREMYIAGEIDDYEFERQLDRLLESEETEARLNRLERERSRSATSTRDRLRER